jgi:hypothetical protein
MWTSTNGMTEWKTSHPTLGCQYFAEPRLEFADGKQHVDPKLGLLLNGPKSYSPIKQHPATVRVGFIGTAESIELGRDWLVRAARGVPGNDKHVAFPGYSNARGFYSELLFQENWNAQVFRGELDDVLEQRGTRTRFEMALALLDSKMDILSRKDQVPEYVIVALPDALYGKCRVTDYRDSTLGEVHRDLRRAFKSLAMKYRIPTQLLRQATSEERGKDHPANVAWDFFTALYSKAGGHPWAPIGLGAGTCYLGISFFRPLGTSSKNVQVSLVQAFDEHGEGLVLRGQDFVWDEEREGTRAPHLTEENAYQLTAWTLARYAEEIGQLPRRVVIHKSSRYWLPERAGFEAALKQRVQQYDLLALSPQSDIRLLPESQYPPLRGTRFTIDDVDLLYTTGYVSELNRFFGMHVPAPLLIADHVGYDTPRDTLLKEVLILTKMNSNSANFAGLMPITLRFSRLVGDIMREIPPDREPLPNFKYYT